MNKLAADFMAASQDCAQAEKDLRSVQNRLDGFREALEAARKPLEKLVGMNIQRKVLATGYPRWAVVVTWHPAREGGPPERVTVDLEEVLDG